MAEQKQEQVNQTQQPLAIRAKELAVLLGVSLRQVWRLSSSGKLPKPLRLGGSVRWALKEIEAFVEAGCPNRASWETMKTSGSHNG